MTITFERVPIEIIDIGVETQAKIEIDDVLLHTSFIPTTGVIRAIKTGIKMFVDSVLLLPNKEYSVKIKNDSRLIKCYVGGASNILVSKELSKRTAAEWSKVILDSGIEEPIHCYFTQ